MTYDELMKALECHAEKNWCEKCPIQDSETCSMDIAREALKVLDKRQMALKTVMMALEKGGYSVTVNPTGEVWIRPWGEMARWIKDAKDNIWHCSACGYTFGLACKTFKFCPKCGAAMEDDDE